MSLDHQELGMLVPIIEVHFKGKTSGISESEIHEFLQSSEVVALPRDVKLIALASSLRDYEVNLDWPTFELIYDVALQQIHDASGVRAVWLNFAIGEWLELPTAYSRTDRLLAAKFAADLLTEDWAADPTDSHTAHCFGLINLYYPDRTEEHLRTALSWFNTAVNLSNSDLSVIDSIVGIGDINFELGNWSEALRAYERLNKPLLRNLEKERQAVVKERILDCKRSL